MKPSLHRELDKALWEAIPDSLLRRIHSLERRLLPVDLDQTIEELCAWRSLQLWELSKILNRSFVYLQNTSIKRLLKEGRIQFLYSDEPNHPQQAYAVGHKGATIPVRSPVRVSKKPRPAKPPPSPVVLPSVEESELDIGRND